jgi:steroid delta-isomerase
MPVAVDTVRSVVDSYVTAQNTGDRAALLALFAPDGEFHDPVGTPPHVGRDAIGAFFDQVRTMARSFALEPKDVIVCGTEAAMVFEIHVTIDDTNSMIIDGVEIFVVNEDGQIASLRAYWDMSRARTRG